MIVVFESKSRSTKRYSRYMMISPTCLLQSRNSFCLGEIGERHCCLGEIGDSKDQRRVRFILLIHENQEYSISYLKKQIIMKHLSIIDIWAKIYVNQIIRTQDPNFPSPYSGIRAKREGEKQKTLRPLWTMIEVVLVVVKDVDGNEEYRQR